VRQVKYRGSKNTEPGAAATGAPRVNYRGSKNTEPGAAATGAPRVNYRGSKNTEPGAVATGCRLPYIIVSMREHRARHPTEQVVVTAPGSDFVYRALLRDLLKRLNQPFNILFVIKEVRGNANSLRFLCDNDFLLSQPGN
jgi:hypothetical protein